MFSVASHAITDIYVNYQTMPSLQLHMRRVAAVALTICQHFDQPLTTSSIVSACLLHDMANILKSDFSVFPDFIQPEGLAFWEKVKSDFNDKYGTDLQSAALKIVEELGLSQRTSQLLAIIGFKSLEKVDAGRDWGQKICEYADLRVMPRGINTLEARWQDLENRYAAQYPSAEDAAQRQRLGQLIHKIEAQIFAHCAHLQPTDLTDSALSDTIKSLETYQVV